MTQSGAVQPMIAPRPRGPYLHRDSRYVAEFLSFAFRHDTIMQNVRLGPAPLELRQRYPDLDVDRWARVWAKTCDAIVVTPTDLVLIEGELRRPVAAIGELVVYRRLVSQTQSLARWWSAPIRTLLLTPLPDPTLDPILEELRIEQIQYRPLWVEEYLRQVQRL